jgi:hypothetical protein
VRASRVVVEAFVEISSKTTITAEGVDENVPGYAQIATAKGSVVGDWA